MGATGERKAGSPYQLEGASRWAARTDAGLQAAREQSLCGCQFAEVSVKVVGMEAVLCWSIFGRCGRVGGDVRERGTGGWGGVEWRGVAPRRKASDPFPDLRSPDMTPRVVVPVLDSRGTTRQQQGRGPQSSERAKGWIWTSQADLHKLLPLPPCHSLSWTMPPIS